MELEIANALRESNKILLEIAESLKQLNKTLTIDEDENDVQMEINDTIDELNQVKEEERLPIKIYINTDGGDLYAALSIVDAIKLSKTPIFTIVIGTAFSGGFFISMVGHKRFCYPNASFMFHEGGCVWEGDAHKFHSHEQHYKSLLERVKKIVMDNSNINEEYYNAIRKDDNWWNAEEALKLKIIDNIMTKEDINNE